MTLGQKLQEMRLDAGMSQWDASEASGVPVSAIRNYEQDRTRVGLEAAARLTAAYGTSLEDLRPFLGL